MALLQLELNLRLDVAILRCCAVHLLPGTKLITLHRGQGCYLAVSTSNTDGIIIIIIKLPN
jgi:hypothetical protein